jgi:hypothetical protein
VLRPYGDGEQEVREGCLTLAKGILEGVGHPTSFFEGRAQGMRLLRL